MNIKGTCIYFIMCLMLPPYCLPYSISRNWKPYVLTEFMKLISFCKCSNVMNTIAQSSNNLLLVYVQVLFDRKVLGHLKYCTNLSLLGKIGKSILTAKRGENEAYNMIYQ